MLREKFLRARPGKIAGGLVVACALVAIKTVRGAGIDISFRLRLFLFNLLTNGRWNAFVLLAEMHLERAFRLFVGELADHAAVKRDSRRKSRDAAGGQKRRSAAHAEPDNAKRADAFEIALRGSDIGHHVIPVEIAQIAAGVSDFIGRVAALAIADETVEHRWCHGHVAKRGEPVADRADVMIDPKISCTTTKPPLGVPDGSA